MFHGIGILLMWDHIEILLVYEHDIHNMYIINMVGYIVFASYEKYVPPAFSKQDATMLLVQYFCFVSTILVPQHCCILF